SATAAGIRKRRQSMSGSSQERTGRICRQHSEEMNGLTRDCEVVYVSRAKRKQESCPRFVREHPPHVDLRDSPCARTQFRASSAHCFSSCSAALLYHERPTISPTRFSRSSLHPNTRARAG